jgi:hypothetical protein
VNPLTEDNHQLAGLLHPNPTYDTLVLHAPPGSHIRQTRGYQVEHYYPPQPAIEAPPAPLALEPDAVHDPPERGVIEPVKPRKPRARKAVAQ